jgi:hypothetical protein
VQTRRLPCTKAGDTNGDTILRLASATCVDAVHGLCAEKFPAAPPSTFPVELSTNASSPRSELRLSPSRQLWSLRRDPSRPGPDRASINRTVINLQGCSLGCSSPPSAPVHPGYASAVLPAARTPMNPSGSPPLKLLIRGFEPRSWRMLLIFDAEDHIDMAQTMTSIWNELQVLSPDPRSSSSTPAMWRG